MKRIGGFFVSFSFLFLYRIFVIKVQEIAWSASYGENKTQNRKQTKQGNILRPLSSTGVGTGPRPSQGHEIKTSKLKETLPQPAKSARK